MTDNNPPPGVGDGDPAPLRGGVCEQHGEFNNFSGRCLTCIPAGELLRYPKRRP